MVPLCFVVFPSFQSFEVSDIIIIIRITQWSADGQDASVLSYWTPLGVKTPRPVVTVPEK